LKRTEAKLRLRKLNRTTQEDGRGVGRMKREFKLGEVYRPRVHILKIKKDKPTVIKVSGEEYILRHKDQYQGREM